MLSCFALSKSSYRAALARLFGRLLEDALNGLPSISKREDRQQGTGDHTSYEEDDTQSELRHVLTCLLGANGFFAETGDGRQTSKPTLCTTTGYEN